MKVSRAALVYSAPEFTDADGYVKDVGPTNDKTTLEVQEGFLLILVEGVIKRMVPLANVVWVEP